MVLSTQVANRDRQSASLYPFPLTPLLGLLNFASAGVVAGILADFVYELHGEKMSIPTEIIVALAAAGITVLEQLASFVRQRFSAFSAKLNLFCHLGLSALWIAAFALLTYRLNGMVLAHTCSLAVWRTDMGLMVCRMYKAVYAFSAVCVATSLASAALDFRVLREGSAGVYRPLGGVVGEQSQYFGSSGNGGSGGRGYRDHVGAVGGNTPDLGGQEKSPMLGVDH